MNKKFTQRGRTMIEMIGVLGIMGILSVGGIAMYDKALQKYRTNQAIDQIMTMIANLNTIKLRQGSYKGISKDKPEVLVKLNVVPSEIVQKTGTGSTTTYKLISAYNGTVEIGTANSYGSSGKGFDAEKDVIITYKGISKDTCLNMASKDWGKKRTGVIATYKNGPDAFIKNYSKSTAEECNNTSGYGAACYNQVMPMAQAVKGCNCTAKNCSFSVWVF